MARHIEWWECEICERRYESEKAAVSCESRGRVAIDRYPVGCVYMDHPTTGFYGKHLCFAVAEVRPFAGHSCSIILWACRDNGAGDSLGESRCGGNDSALWHGLKYADPEAPTFKRLVNWLQSEGIPVTVWDGEKAVPLRDWKPNVRNGIVIEDTKGEA